MHAKHLSYAPLLLCAAIAHAQTTPPPIPTELRSRFGFDGPLITKVGEGIGDLQLADVYGDGGLEAVVYDSRRARLAVLRVRDGAVTTDEMPTDGQIANFTYADIRGDGKPELLVTDGRGRLKVHHPKTRGAAADTTPPVDLGLNIRGLGSCVGDLDGDGKMDLVLLSRGSLRWVTKLADHPQLSPIESLEENAHSFDLIDLDGDKKLDMVYMVPTETLNVRLRRGHGDGTFGPWLITGIETLHHLFPTRLPGGGAGLATIQGPHRRVTLEQFADHGGQAPLIWWPLPEGQSQKAPPFALGDVDGDGDEDLVLAQPEKAQLLLFLWQGDTFVVRTVPTLAGVSSIAIGDVDKDGKPDLVFTSPEEDTLAWKSGAAPLDQFAAQVPCTDKPIAAATDPAGGILVLARNDKREGHLDRVSPGGEPVRLADLGRVQGDPPRLLLADIGDAPGLEVAYVVPNEGLRIVTIPPASAAPADKPAKPSDAAGFTKKMDDGSLAVCSVDGKQALLAVRERYVRTFRTDAKGQLQVLAQDNGPAGLAELSLAALLRGGNRLYLDKKNNKLVRTVAGETPTTIDVPPYEFTHLLAHADAALLIGPRGLLRVPFGSGPTLREIAGHEPPTEHTHYWHGQTGDFDHDGIPDLAMLDGDLPGVQILAGGPSGLQRALAIQVYEAPPSLEPAREPRELRVGDLNGDGLDDLAMVVFDRVLIYLQQK